MSERSRDRRTLFAAQEIGQQTARVRPQRFRHLDKLDDIQPALAPFILGHEGLGPAEPRRDIGLGQVTGFPDTDEQILKVLLPGRAERFGHDDRLIDETGRPSNPDFGLSHIGILLPPITNAPEKVGP